MYKYELVVAINISLCAYNIYVRDDDGYTC